MALNDAYTLSIFLSCFLVLTSKHPYIKVHLVEMESGFFFSVKLNKIKRVYA